MNDEQQRAALLALLEEGERRVPSTVARIQEAIQQEAQTQRQPTLADNGRERIVPMAGGQRPAQRDRRSSMERATHQRRVIVWRNVAAVAMAAVVILAATALFSHRLFLPGGTSGKPYGQPTITEHAISQTISPALIHSPTTVPSSTASSARTPGTPSALFGGWNAAMVAVPAGSSGVYLIKNYDYTNGFSTVLNTSPLPASTQFDGISSDGQDLLYQYTSSNHVYYARLLTTLANTGYFYELNAANAGNAIWMPDDRHVLITTKNIGVIEVDTLSGLETPYLPRLLTSGLAAYHTNFLYYRDTNYLVSRINVVSGVVQTLTGRIMNSAVWLSPDGTTLYWVNAGPAGPFGIYATNVNSANMQFLRGSGEPVGFAADNSLLTVRLLNGQVQVVKLGATQQQDQVVFANAAPGATSLCAATMAAPHQICDSFVAMAPYGHALIVQGTDAAGSYHLWSDDLETGLQFALDASPDHHVAAQLPGWDRIAVPG